jgi:hypothetical protein
MTFDVGAHFVRPLAFVDIDDSLLVSGRARTARHTRVVGTSASGSAGAFMAPEHEQLFTWLNATTELIPTTGRAVEAFRRLELPFCHGAILAHGAIVMNADGSRDDSWHDVVAERCRTTHDELMSLYDQVRQFLSRHSSPIGGRIVHDQDLPLYIAFRDPQQDDAARRLLGEFLCDIRPDSWLIHNNTAHLALLPGFIRKSEGVRWRLRNEDPDRLRIGLGDSLSDVEFMHHCHLSAVPVPSQAFATLVEAGKRAERGFL